MLVEVITQSSVASSSSSRGRRAVEADALGLVQPDHGLGHRVVVGVADGADGGHHAGVASRSVNRIAVY